MKKRIAKEALLEYLHEVMSGAKKEEDFIT